MFYFIQLYFFHSFFGEAFAYQKTRVDLYKQANQLLTIKGMPEKPDFSSFLYCRLAEDWCSD